MFTNPEVPRHGGPSLRAPVLPTADQQEQPTACPRGDVSQSQRPRRRRARKTGNWTDQKLQKAIAEVDDGLSMKKAAKENGIPYSSLRDWCYGRTRSRDHGAKPVLTAEEEVQLLDYLIAMCDAGYGLSPTALKMKVYEITKTRWMPFCEGIPGGSWMRWFQNRHPELIVRASQALESARARALCPENVATLYDNLQQLYEEYQYPPERIWNCDESSAQAGIVLN